MDRSLSAQYAVLFSRPWPVWGSAILVATVNVFLFAFDRPWTASDGMRNWGDWVLTGLGVVRRADLLAPWLYSGSLLNAGVLLGGLVAALLSSEFAVRVPPRGELVKGAFGGLLMGVGAVLAFGCNIGGFFSATSALSLRARVPGAVHDRRRRAHARRGVRAREQHGRVGDPQVHRPQGQERVGLPRRRRGGARRRPRVRRRDDAGRRVRRRLDLARGRGAGEGLGRGRGLRPWGGARGPRGRRGPPPSPRSRRPVPPA